LPFITALLQQEVRVTYRSLQQAFNLDDELLSEIREELLVRQIVTDEGGNVLVWIGGKTITTGPVTNLQHSAVISKNPEESSVILSSPEPFHNEPADSRDHLSSESSLNPPAGTSKSNHKPRRAERRQLTVMFCDLVGSTDLSGKLDPEDLREVVRAYQQSAAEIIEKYDGHIAQYLGDGLLIYFGYPVAHEDDAQRAVLTGLGIPEALATLNNQLEATYSVKLAVRIGIHTGPVVVGEMGGGNRHENLALGETPNIAARLEGFAQPNTVVVSPLTAQLVNRSFMLRDLGLHELKGVAEALNLYVVISSRRATKQDEFQGGQSKDLMGRNEETGLLLRRWEQSKEGQGQVVLITGEAGIGKSSLVAGIRQHVNQEQLPCITFRCSQYHQNSALYPVIDHLQRFIGFERNDSMEDKLAKLKKSLEPYDLPMADVIPLFSNLLSINLPEDQTLSSPLAPSQQRQQTLDALNAWILDESEHQPILILWEDLHWADPTTLELLGSLLEQSPTTQILNTLMFRPDFIPPWPARSHMTPITLNRLERLQVEALITRLAGGKNLPTEVVNHIVTKTDGVPLFVEELTKTVINSTVLEESGDHYQLTGPLSEVAIPTTLNDSLMARLDQLPTVREMAQLGSVVGREFAYEVLQALSKIEKPDLNNGLSQLVEHELLYQRGRPPRAKYTFKHALVQDAAYQSLLRQRRKQYHQQVAELFESRFSEIVESEPELLAYHYTEANCPQQAITYWLKAGQRAAHSSAHREAIAHLTKGIEILHTLTETPQRNQQDLALHVALGGSLIAVKGYAAPDVEKVYTKARSLCQEIGENPEVFQILRGLFLFYLVRGRMETAQELAQQMLQQADKQSEVAPRMLSHYLMGMILFFRADHVTALSHVQQAITLYDSETHRELAYFYGIDPGVGAYGFEALLQWILGYPDRALTQSRKGLALAEHLDHPFSKAFALDWLAWIHQFRQEAQNAADYSLSAIKLADEHGFALYVAWGTVSLGWALTVQEPGNGSIYRLREAMDSTLATGSEVFRPYFLALLAEAHGNQNQIKEGLRVLDEAQKVIERTGEHFYQAEIYRLTGVLQLLQADDMLDTVTAKFHQAIATAQTQGAKSLELRATTNLSQLWRDEGQIDKARELLMPIYNFFNEGLDTEDLKNAKQLLDELEATIKTRSA